MISIGSGSTVTQSIGGAVRRVIVRCRLLARRLECDLERYGGQGRANEVAAHLLISLGRLSAPGFQEQTACRGGQRFVFEHDRRFPRYIRRDRDRDTDTDERRTDGPRTYLAPRSWGTSKVCFGSALTLGCPWSLEPCTCAGLPASLDICACNTPCGVSEGRRSRKAPQRRVCLLRPTTCGLRRGHAGRRAASGREQNEGIAQVERISGGIMVHAVVDRRGGAGWARE